MKRLLLLYLYSPIPPFKLRSSLCLNLTNQTPNNEGTGSHCTIFPEVWSKRSLMSLGNSRTECAYDSRPSAGAV